MSDVINRGSMPSWPRVKLICFGRGEVRTGERILEFGQSISLPPGTRWIQVIGLARGEVAS